MVIFASGAMHAGHNLGKTLVGSLERGGTDEAETALA